MARCFTGSVLHVNLSDGKLWVEHPEDEFYRTYAGGSSMGLYYLLKEIPRGADPFSAENVMTLFAGLPTGLAISGQSRLAVSAKSPITGGIGDSQSGGFFPANLKFAGFDGIVIYGQSLKPVYLFIDDGQAELRDASHLWGKPTLAVDEALVAEIGDSKIEILQCGPAGEKLVRFAALLSMHNRANGRTGMGAVMGSKQLKAVVVRGRQKMTAANGQKVAALNRTGTKSIPEVLDVYGLQKNGTPDVIVFQHNLGSLPTRNYNEGQFEGHLKICGDTYTDTILKESDTCHACTVRCKRVVETEYKGQKVLPTYGGPEYETVATFGSYCGIDDLPAIALANQICNAHGLDTIAAGATIAFAMECFENGLLTLEDTGGIELRFGNADAMLAMLEKIAVRDGLGDLLAEGSERAAAKIGRGADAYLITCKGAEAPAHMPQAKRSLSIHYAVNPYGADHQSAEHDPMYEEGAGDFYYDRLAMLGLDQVQPGYSMNDEKVRFSYKTEVFYSALDSYCLCQFVWGPAWTLYGPQEMAEMLSAATGWGITLDEIMRVGERRLNMMRLFNLREGLTRADDRLPKKFMLPLKGEGPSAGVAFSLEEMEHYKDVYYTLAGWDLEKGQPAPEKIAALGLEWVQLA